MHVACNLIEGDANFMQSIGPQFCNIVIWELMKMVVKLREEQEHGGVYAQCLTTTPAAKQKIHWCLCPMRGSIVYAVPKA